MAHVGGCRFGCLLFNCVAHSTSSVGPACLEFCWSSLFRRNGLVWSMDQCHSPDKQVSQHVKVWVWLYLLDHLGWVFWKLLMGVRSRVFLRSWQKGLLAFTCKKLQPFQHLLLFLCPNAWMRGGTGCEVSGGLREDRNWSLWRGVSQLSWGRKKWE